MGATKEPGHIVLHFEVSTSLCQHPWLTGICQQSGKQEHTRALTSTPSRRRRQSCKCISAPHFDSESKETPALRMHLDPSLRLRVERNASLANASRPIASTPSQRRRLSCECMSAARHNTINIRSTQHSTSRNAYWLRGVNLGIWIVISTRKKSDRSCCTIHPLLATPDPVCTRTRLVGNPNGSPTLSYLAMMAPVLLKLQCQNSQALQLKRAQFFLLQVHLIMLLGTSNQC